MILHIISIGTPAPDAYVASMAAQIMRAQMDADHHFSFYHHYPGRLILNRKNSIIRPFAFLPSVIPQTIGCFLGNKYNLLFFSAFRTIYDQFAILIVAKPQFKNLTDSNRTAGH